MGSDREIEKTQSPGEAIECFSPPCAMAGVDPAYNGRMMGDELIEQLNVLLEAERAGAAGITEVCLPATPSAHQAAMKAVAADEGRFCSMLYRHIVRLGGTPGTTVGGFREKLAAVETFPEQLEFLNRGQAWVVRKLRDIVPRIDDALLHTDLMDMLKVHEQNIERCTVLAASESS
ncbi:MAG: hypothetical protein ACI915_004918 [Gammaproteobacteria bacterium]|jgi:hypothetical protein